MAILLLVLAGIAACDGIATDVGDNGQVYMLVEGGTTLDTTSNGCVQEQAVITIDNYSHAQSVWVTKSGAPCDPNAEGGNIKPFAKKMSDRLKIAISQLEAQLKNASDARDIEQYQKQLERAKREKTAWDKLK